MCWFESSRSHLTQLDDHLARVEKHGFDRDVFPVSYNGHRISILSNDGYMEEGRLLFDFVLYCPKCTQESSVSGRFPANYDNHIEHVCNARVAVFERFNTNECE